MHELDKIYCDCSRVRVAPISKTTAKEIIVAKHYTHAWTACRVALGIFYTTDTTDALGDNEKLIGCAIYGFPVGAKAPTSICEGLTKDNVLELTRLFIDDGYGSNIESYALGQTFKWLREYEPNIKVLISYADNGHEHLGKIYQATNWVYESDSNSNALMLNFGISLQENPYKWIHSRTVFSMYGSNNLDHLKREIGKDGYKCFFRRQEPTKHRYIMILATDKREKKDLVSRLKHEQKPYPKSTLDYEAGIERHETVAPDSGNAIKFW